MLERFWKRQTEVYGFYLNSQRESKFKVSKVGFIIIQMLTSTYRKKCLRKLFSHPLPLLLLTGSLERIMDEVRLNMVKW